MILVDFVCSSACALRPQNTFRLQTDPNVLNAPDACPQGISSINLLAASSSTFLSLLTCSAGRMYCLAREVDRFGGTRVIHIIHVRATERHCDEEILNQSASGYLEGMLDFCMN